MTSEVPPVEGSQRISHDCAVEEHVPLARFYEAETALRNALSCDAYRAEVENARRAAVRLGDECERLASALAAIASRAKNA